MATRFTNDSTGRDSVITCQTQGFGPDHASRDLASQQGDTASAEVAARRKSSFAKRLRLWASLGFLIAPATGCTILSGMGRQMAHQEAIDDFMVNYRNEAWAAKAWHCRKHKFCNKKYLGDLEAGFRAGYESVAAGGNGCVPSVCPQSYWGWQYQAADGQCRMNAWFEGFPLGVQAAEQDGIGNWSQVRTAMAVPPPVYPAPVAAAGMSAGMAAGMAAEPTPMQVMEAAPGTKLGDGPVVEGLSDQVEPVPAPVADGKGTMGTKQSPKQTPQDKAPGLNLPGTALPPAATAKPAVPKASVPADLNKAPIPLQDKAPLVDPPKADPFGFD